MTLRYSVHRVRTVWSEYIDYLISVMSSNVLHCGAAVLGLTVLHCGAGTHCTALRCWDSLYCTAVLGLTVLHCGAGTHRSVLKNGSLNQGQTRLHVIEICT
jgi:hypothetical protein